jgi:FHA domain-containing protein
VTVLPDHTPELRGAYRPPEVRPAKPPVVEGPERVDGPPAQAARAMGSLSPEPAARAPRASAGSAAASSPVPRARGHDSADVQALWRAFEHGAGIGRLPDEALTPELMDIVGRLLRTSVEGTLRLMAARTATKQELRAQVTVIQSHDNNPLKFTPDPQAALEQLLRPPVRGFMPGTVAVEDAMDDLLGHAVGTMAGMRAALQGVLARFTPAQLEAALSEPSMLDKLLPMNRHAKLWELYLAHHARVQGDAEDRFDSLFGAAFVKAYEEQLDELARARTRRAGADARPDAPRPRPDAG